jgi:hypothetical protein
MQPLRACHLFEARKVVEHAGHNSKMKPKHVFFFCNNGLWRSGQVMMQKQEETKR